MSTLPLSVMWMVSSSWTSGAYIVYKYNIVVKNTGTDIYSQIYIKSSNINVTQSWSVTPKNPSTPYIFEFPSYMTSLAPGQQYTFGCITTGKSTFSVDTYTIQPIIIPTTTITPSTSNTTATTSTATTSTVPSTSNTTTTTTPSTSNTTTTPSTSNTTTTTTPSTTPTTTNIITDAGIITFTSNTDLASGGGGSVNDNFGIKMLNKSTSDPTVSREWYSQWDKGSLRTFTFGKAGATDPELMFRGSGKYTIYGSTDANRAGMMSVTGSTPRIYIRNSDVEGDVLPSTVKKWGNVEITFYANTTNLGSNVGYAGIEAVARTNHMPDTALCGTRGYGGKINFDGRAQFEKECCHGSGNKQVATVYPFTNKGKMPINTWIGYKFIVRACENNTKCKLELYMDMTDGLNGGDWKLLTQFTDYDGWSSDIPSCCDAHKGKVLLPPNQMSNYTVYLRSDGLGEQLYKKLSIREIDQLP